MKHGKRLVLTFHETFTEYPALTDTFRDTVGLHFFQDLEPQSPHH